MYLDSALDRREAAAKAEFNGAVEAARMGAIFAHDGKQYGRWARAAYPTVSRGLTGENLEAAIASFAVTHPEYVVRGPD